MSQFLDLLSTRMRAKLVIQAKVCSKLSKSLQLATARITPGRGFLLFLVHDLRSEASITSPASSEKCEMLGAARNMCVLYPGKYLDLDSV